MHKHVGNTKKLNNVKLLLLRGETVDFYVDVTVPVCVFIT